MVSTEFHGDGHDCRSVIEGVIEDLSVGLAFFDGSDALTWFNRRFAELFCASENPCLDAGMGYGDVIRRAAETLVFGNGSGPLAPEDWVAERLQLPRKGGLSEGEHADGQRILIEERQTKEGHTVLIVSEACACPEGQESPLATPDGEETSQEATSSHFAELAEKLDSARIQAAEVHDAEAFREYLRQARGQMETEVQEVQEKLTREQSVRRLLEEDLQIANKLAKAAERAKSEFLATMSHELRTPLNAIIGFSEVLLARTFGDPANEKHLEYLEAIHESGRHLLEQINGILEFSYLASGKINLEEENVDMGEMISQVTHDLDEEIQAGRIGIDINLPDTPPILIANRRMIAQILRNLVGNALKFNVENGGVILEIAQDPETRDMIVTVADTGIGMTDTEVFKALDSFSQVDSRLARRYEGAGLGLNLSKRLVEVHGGTLELESAKGVGTMVTVRFPARRVLDPAVGTWVI